MKQSTKQGDARGPVPLASSSHIGPQGLEGQNYYKCKCKCKCNFGGKKAGPYPQYGWHFPEEIPAKFRKDPGNALRAFPGIPVESTAGIPQAL